MFSHPVLPFAFSFVSWVEKSFPLLALPGWQVQLLLHLLRFPPPAQIEGWESGAGGLLGHAGRGPWSVRGLGQVGSAELEHPKLTSVVPSRSGAFPSRDTVLAFPYHHSSLAAFHCQAWLFPDSCNMICFSFFFFFFFSCHTCSM